MALTSYPNPVGTTAELSQVVDNDLNDGEWAYVAAGKQLYNLDKTAVAGIATPSGEGKWVLFTGGSPVDVDAVIPDVRAAVDDAGHVLRQGWPGEDLAALSIGEISGSRRLPRA